MRLKDKVALVTGSKSGIGKAIAERFSAEGAYVAVNFREKANNRAEAERIVASLPTDGIAVEGDISTRADAQRIVDEIIARFGRLDIAVNNAAIEAKKPFLEVDDEEWDRVIKTNLYGPFLVTQIAARQMVKQGGGGRIVNISSVHEDIPFEGYTSYCVAKGGIRMMTRNLCLEFAPHRITINNIAPGAIATPINQKVLEDPEAKNNALSEIPFGRFGTPEEVASVAVFLASDEAAYVTGSTYYIDGGLTQQVTKY
jgi:glucose 1-dehydrogenase